MTNYIAFDFETYLITPDNIVPKPVCLSYYDTDKQGIILSSDVEKFIESIANDTVIIAHNLKFELGVIYKYYPKLREWIWNRLDNDLFYDTLISEKILDLARTGNLGKYSLDVLVQRYLKIDISESKKKDSDSWRYRYSELDEVPINSWPSEAYAYALNDSIYTYQIAELQKYSNDPLSVRADFVLNLATEYGFEVDSNRINTLADELIERMKPFRNIMLESGFAILDKKGVIKKKSKDLREYVLSLNADATKTSKGATAISSKALKGYEDPVINAFYSISKLEKLSTAFIPRLKDAVKCRGTIHPSFNVLVSTGRTSSIASKLFPSCNIQQMPRSGGIRECFIPRDGFSLVSIDYNALELHSVGQQILNYLGESTHVKQINHGDTPVDLHAFLGSKLMSVDTGVTISYEDFIKNKKQDEFKHFRKLAKPVGLGFPGGLGAETFVDFARTTYGVIFTLDEAYKLKELYYDIYPDFAYFMKSFSKKFTTGKRIRIKLDTEDEDGNEYKWIDEYYYVVGNRARRGCTFTSFANGILMQSLSSDGAKISAYNVARFLEKNNLGRMLAFIHDEVIVEIPADSTLPALTEKISYIMCESMKEVMPDVRITVEASEMPERWSKEGPFGFEGAFWVNKDNSRGKIVSS